MLFLHKNILDTQWDRFDLWVLKKIASVISFSSFLRFKFCLVIVQICYFVLKKIHLLTNNNNNGNKAYHRTGSITKTI